LLEPGIRRAFFSAKTSTSYQHRFQRLFAAQSISMQLNGLPSKQNDIIATVLVCPAGLPAAFKFFAPLPMAEDFDPFLYPIGFRYARTCAKSGAYAAFRIHAGEITTIIINAH
jgi:hypothetical protein